MHVDMALFWLSMIIGLDPMNHKHHGACGPRFYLLPPAPRRLKITKGWCWESQDLQWQNATAVRSENLDNWLWISSSASRVSWSSRSPTRRRIRRGNFAWVLPLWTIIPHGVLFSWCRSHNLQNQLFWGFRGLLTKRESGKVCIY